MTKIFLVAFDEEPVPEVPEHLKDIPDTCGHCGHDHRLGIGMIPFKELMEVQELALNSPHVEPELNAYWLALVKAEMNHRNKVLEQKFLQDPDKA